MDVKTVCFSKHYSITQFYVFENGFEVKFSTFIKLAN